MHHSTRCPKHAALSAAHCSTRHNYTGVVGQLIKARGAVGPGRVSNVVVVLCLALLVIHCGTSMGVDAITQSNLISVMKVQRASVLMTPSFMPGHDHICRHTHTVCLSFTGKVAVITTILINLACGMVKFFVVW